MECVVHSILRSADVRRFLRSANVRRFSLKCLAMFSSGTLGTRCDADTARGFTVRTDI